ncbi:MAG: GumC domain-containing protein [Planctomycetota bacterium]|jgi:uncharacterized protein involved in exopolysaccharide biosynthesis
MNDHPRNLSDSDPPSVSVTEPGAVAAWQAPLLDVLAVLARRRLLIIAIVTAGAVAGTLQYLRTPSFYRASAVAVLLPREKPAVDMAVSSATVETTEDGAKRANSGSLMLPPQTDLYVALLGSRSVLESLAGQFGDRLARLRELKANDRSDEIVMRLKDMVSVAGTDEGLLTFTVTADDPVLASDLANAMVQEGQRASKAIERQLLVQQAGYLEYAVRASAERLTDAESRLKSFCERHRLIDPNLQATDSLRQIRELDAVRERRAIELARRRLSHTDADPGVRALQHEIELTDQRLVALHAEITSGIGDEEYGRLLVEFEGLRQEVRFRRDLLGTLSTQTEVFRIRAEQPAGNIAVVRPAVPVHTPAGPSRKKTFGLAVGGAMFAAVALCLVLEQVRLVRRDPALANRLDEVRDAILSPVLRLPVRRAADRRS